MNQEYLYGVDAIIRDEEMLRKREIQTRLNRYFMSEIDIDEQIRADKRYYIGSYNEINNLHILEATIYPDTFYKYSNEDILEYLNEFGLTQQYTNTPAKIDILQLHILDDEWNTYMVVVKTFWIRLIQRKWRRIFQSKPLKI